MTMVRVHSIILLSLLLQAYLNYSNAMSTSAGHHGPKHRVAVIGGGITGCAVARQLMELVDDDDTNNNNNIDVTVLDWGRAVGGRASHRYRPEVSTADPDKTLTLHFDHGAQFFHANNDTLLDMVRPAVQHWKARVGWLQSQTGEFSSSNSSSSSSSTTSSDDVGFFGACDSNLDARRYVGVGGMNAIANELLRGAKELGHGGRLHVLEGTRVARCERIRSGWKLYGDGLSHEQADAKAVQEANEQELGEFDELVVTDHMALGMPSWHPCHIVGLEDAVPELISSVRQSLEWDESARRFRSVKPLFSCMVAFEGSMDLEFDAAAIRDDDILQWVCCQESRPHEKDDTTVTDNLERWVLVSKPEFAEHCLGSEVMSKPSSSKTQSTSSKEGDIEYVPQTDEYLRADPADQMVQAFLDLVKSARIRDGTDHVVPKVAFRKCQRWGAAFTSWNPERNSHHTDKIAKEHEATHSITLCGDFLHAWASGTQEEESNSFAIQNAALSGVDAAHRMAARLKHTR